MNKKWIPSLIMATVLLMTGTAWSSGFSLALKGGYFWPMDEVFKEVYTNGPVFGGEIAVRLVGGLDFWAGADFFSKKGSLTFSEEETKVRIIPLHTGVRYRFSTSAVSPYLAAAAGYFLFKEESVIGTEEGNRFGFLGQAGILAGLSRAVALDVYVRYWASKIPIEGFDEEADLSGIQAGLGLAIRF